MNWSTSFTKSSGKLKAQHQMCTIPKKVRDRLDVVDGDYCVITLSYARHHEVLTVKITSGGEFRLPANISENLQEYAAKEPSSSATFTIDEAISAALLFERKVSISNKLKREDRLARLKTASSKPLVRIVQTTIFDRNQDVVAEVLYRAMGICERCKTPAPFIRRSNQTPYLEVHHRVQLAQGGEDTVENAEALCPNCHRKAHHGIIE
jgi:5-methylcytosine-specific restriction endonuclease McrA